MPWARSLCLRLRRACATAVWMPSRLWDRFALVAHGLRLAPADAHQPAGNVGEQFNPSMVLLSYQPGAQARPPRVRVRPQSTHRPNVPQSRARAQSAVLVGAHPRRSQELNIIYI